VSPDQFAHTRSLVLWPVVGTVVLPVLAAAVTLSGTVAGTVGSRCSDSDSRESGDVTVLLVRYCRSTLLNLQNHS
jgi:hypothetical protein